jgi:hypothetical protein
MKMDSYDVVATDLARRIEASEAMGKRNSSAAYGFIAIGVFASAAATISVAAGTLTPAMNAVLAALPGIVVTVLNTFKFEQQSKWWWKKNLMLTKIKAGLQRDGSNATEVEQQATAFLLKHQEDWPGPEFARPPSSS